MRTWSIKAEIVSVNLRVIAEDSDISGTSFREAVEQLRITQKCLQPMNGSEAAKTARKSDMESSRQCTCGNWHQSQQITGWFGPKILHDNAKNLNCKGPSTPDFKCKVLYSRQLKAGPEPSVEYCTCPGYPVQWNCSKPPPWLLKSHMWWYGNINVQGKMQVLRYSWNPDSW